MDLELVEGAHVSGIADADFLLAPADREPWVARTFLQPPLLNLAAHLEVEFDEQSPVIALLRLELVDLVEGAGHRLVIGSAENAVVKHAPVPAAEEDGRLTGSGQLTPETPEPMPFGRFAAV